MLKSLTNILKTLLWNLISIFLVCKLKVIIGFLMQGKGDTQDENGNF